MAAEAQAPRRHRRSLRWKLGLAVAVLSALTCATLLLWFGPRCEQVFAGHGAAMIGDGAAALQQMAADHAITSREVLFELVRRSADARRRDLDDLPLALYDGDADRIAAAIDQLDAARSERLLENIAVLGREMERRAAAGIRRHVEALTAVQKEIGAAFGADLRRSHLLLSGLALAAAMVVLGLFLDRCVVRPVQLLRRATRQVAAGDLDVAIAGAAPDEIGGLARDFGAMVEQLRSSRAEIERQNGLLRTWNERLSREVALKTGHLERALDDLREAQQRLAQSDKMAAIGTLAGGVAHEFNNLIGGIRGCVRDVLADSPRTDQRQTLEVALRATERATAVTAKLVQFARPRTAGRAVVELRALVGEVVDLVAPQARRQGVQLSCDLPAGLTVAVNAGEVHQVFLNLLVNALHAMPDGGRLTVTAAGDQQGVTVAVADTGAGITAADLGRVFDPFFSARRGSPGTGLGLAVSYGIVAAHGGAITVRSSPGCGATFTVSLPAPASAASTAE